MADNTLQGGTDLISTDELTLLNGGAVSGFKVQRVKVGYGVDGSLQDVTSAAPLPMTNIADVDNTATGSLAAAAATVVLTISGKSSASVQLSGTWVGTVTFEGTVDGTTWNNVNAVAATTSTPQPTTTVNGLYRLTPGGLSQIRANMTAYTSGSVTVAMRSGNGSGGIFANQILPTKMTDGVSTASIKPASTAAVAADSGLVVTIHPSSATQPVSGTFFQATQPVVVNSNSLVSTVNSSAVALGANAVFTGTAEDVTEYSSVKVSIFADQASATDGLQLQQSINGTNWDFIDAYSVPIATGKTFGAPVQAKFFRVVYTNGAVATTAVRLQTIYSKQAKQTGAHRPQDARGNDNDFEELLSYGMAFNGTSWDRLRTSIANGLVTDVSRIVAALPTGTNSIGTVQQAALTKATQGATGVTTQDLKDAGRVAVMISCYRAAGIITTEALFAAATFASTRDGATATTGVQFSVTAGKRFRIQGVECSLFGNAALATTSKLVLRYLGAGGTITNTSPIAAIWDIGSNVATTGNYVGPMVLPIPDGLEFIAGSSFGFTNVSSAATVLHTITLIGYEY